MQTINVTQHHIEVGVRGDCHRCAVALALREATGDDEVSVVEVECLLRLRVRSRYTVAPVEVMDFVEEFDGNQLAIEDGDEPAILQPFSFEIPDADSADWEEECCNCECLFSPSELDEYGLCEECR